MFKQLSSFKLGLIFGVFWDNLQDPFADHRPLLIVTSDEPGKYFHYKQTKDMAQEVSGGGVVVPEVSAALV